MQMLNMEHKKNTAKNRGYHAYMCIAANASTITCSYLYWNVISLGNSSSPYASGRDQSIKIHRVMRGSSGGRPPSARARIGNLRDSYRGRPRGARQTVGPVAASSAQSMEMKKQQQL